MSVARPDDFIETYRLKASLPDLHELTGRGSYRAGHSLSLTESLIRFRLGPRISSLTSAVAMGSSCGKWTVGS